jgi:hypothetical protein
MMCSHASATFTIERPTAYVAITRVHCPGCQHDGGRTVLLTNFAEPSDFYDDASHVQRLKEHVQTGLLDGSPLADWLDAHAVKK